jgi:hypothetical protein
LIQKLYQPLFFESHLCLNRHFNRVRLRIVVLSDWKEFPMGDFFEINWQRKAGRLIACVVVGGFMLYLPCFIFESGRSIISFDSLTEAKGQTYAQYVARNPPPSSDFGLFNPKGAENISYRFSGTRDGYDNWWRFAISKSDFQLLLSAVAASTNGPNDIKFSSIATPPSNWKPESNLPPWWVIDAGRNPQSIQWCSSAGDAERHHGYFFLYNPESQTAWCWHWNHQWSSSACTQEFVPTQPINP